MTPSVVKFFEVRLKGSFPLFSLYILQIGRSYIRAGFSSFAKWPFLAALRYILIFQIGLHVGPISFLYTAWPQA